MYTHKPAVAYSLDGQIDLLIHSRTHQILRTVSFDDGDTWIEWRKMKNHRTRRTVGFASTADGRTKYMVYQIFNPLVGSTMEQTFEDRNQYVLKMDGHYGFAWNDLSEPIRANRGQFLSGPAVVCSPNGDGFALYGQGLDNKIYWSVSENRGIFWTWTWTKIGDATFKSEPACVMSADGFTIMIFAIGMDNRCYFSRSTDGGKTWNPYAGPIKEKHFTSGPSACISADGNEVMVAARGGDNRVYFIRSADRGNTWNGNWAPILGGVLSGGPGLCGNWDLSKIFVFGVGGDHKIWKAFALGKNAPFQGWWLADRNDKLSAI